MVQARFRGERREGRDRGSKNKICVSETVDVVLYGSSFSNCDFLFVIQLIFGSGCIVMSY